jgi:hypothetical protein
MWAIDPLSSLQKREREREKERKREREKESKREREKERKREREKERKREREKERKREREKERHAYILHAFGFTPCPLIYCSLVLLYMIVD